MHIFLVQFFGFLEFKWVDFFDILFVAILIYFVYKLVRGTIAFNIFIGLFSIYLLWWMVKAFEMKLLSQILGQFIGVGVVALIIVFQQEIRKFLLIIGQNNIFIREDFKLKNLLPWNWKINRTFNLNYDILVHACEELSNTKTGALMVITYSTELKGIASTGVSIEAEISTKLLKTIFFKNSPLHDGAVLIVKNKIRAASCILPVSDTNKLPDHLGLRHRAALGISEQSDAVVIIISEETGSISIAHHGQIKYDIPISELAEILEKSFISFRFNPLDGF